MEKPDKRRNYDAAFRATAPRGAAESRPVSAAARSLNMRSGLFNKWRQAAPPADASEAAEGYWVGRQHLGTALRALQPRAFVLCTADSAHGLRCGPNWLLHQPAPHRRQSGPGLGHHLPDAGWREESLSMRLSGRVYSSSGELASTRDRARKFGAHGFASCTAGLLTRCQLGGAL